MSAGGLYALALGVWTAQRNRDDRDELGMWEDVVACAPDNARAHRNLGFLLVKRGDNARAVEHLRRAIALSPEYPEAHGNLGDALHAWPRNARVRDGYGVARVMADDSAGAVPLFRRAIAADPDLHVAHLHVGLALKAIGEERDAVAALREALRLGEQLTAGGTGGTADDLALLASARAHAGSFEAAVAAAEQARTLAASAGDEERRLEIERQLACYRDGRLCEGAAEPARASSPQTTAREKPLTDRADPR